MPSISEIEDAIIGRLSAAVEYLKACGSLSEFLGRDLEAIEEISPLSPAAYVVYRQGTFLQKISGFEDREMILGVLAVVRNVRGQVAVRHGRGGEKGAYEVLEDIRAALSGQICGVEMQPLVPLSESAVTGAGDLAVYEILFRTVCRIVQGA